MAPDLVAVHAAFAGPAEVVAERRSLYRLAADLVGVEGDLSDDVLDSPLVRNRLGGALAGQVDLRGQDLAVYRDAIGKTDDAAGVPVVADPVAQDALADLLRIIGPVAGLRLLTMADDGFGDVLDVIAGGVRLVREVGGALAADLLAHVELIAVVDPDSAAGLVSASSRYFPGVVVVERPSNAVEVAEALIHEGAHEKFFDLAITRSFLDVKSDRVKEFTPSWSGARWPFEQVFAAWHAYLCLAQFHRDSNGLAVGPASLLPMAAERAVEIGGFLRDHEASLLSDARRMLDAAGDSQYCGESAILSPVPMSVNGCFVTDPLLRSSGALPTGRRVVGRKGSPPALFWLENDSATVLDLFLGAADGLLVEDGVVDGRQLWNAGDQLSRAFVELVETRLIVPAG